MKRQFRHRCLIGIDVPNRQVTDTLAGAQNCSKSIAGPVLPLAPVQSMARDPYRTDESSSSLWFEQAVNATVHIGAIAYVLLSTIYTACNIHSNEMAWIDERGYPGGPLEYQLQQSYTTPIVVANAAAIAITFLADDCMVRLVVDCSIGFGSSAVVLPALLLLSSTTMGILLVLQLALPGAAIWGPDIDKFSIPYWACSIAFTLLEDSGHVGDDYGRAYAGIAAMLIECALPYALISSIFITLYGLRSTAFNLFVPLMIMVEAMTPQLIIIRVARGRGLPSDSVAITSGQISAMQFHTSVPPGTETTVLSDSSMTPLGANVQAMKLAGSLPDSSLEELSKAYPC
ncbi:hypothetical protein IW262DRAFT_1460611 [Armillaria fumosa]|nr:hypothetical protein IW262DRAFT_1460611 [Armillaria fumosa]